MQSPARLSMPGMTDWQIFQQQKAEYDRVLDQDKPRKPPKTLLEKLKDRTLTRKDMMK